MQLKDALREAIAFVCETETSAIHDHATLESLGIDSLMAGQILVEAEITLGYELPVEHLEALRGESTFEELVDALSEPVAVAATSA